MHKDIRHGDGVIPQRERTGNAGALSRLKPYPAYKDSGVEWLGEAPAHWEVKQLKYSALLCVDKLDVKPVDQTYIGLENIESWTGRLLLQDQPESVDSSVGRFKAGDVLFGKLRPYLAKVVRPDFNGVSTGELVVLRPVGSSQGYLFYCLLNEPYIRWVDTLAYGTKMPRVSPGQVGNSMAPFPPLPEQHAIAAFLDRETARIDALVAKKERLIELLQEKRTALITQAVAKGLDPDVPMKDSGVEWLGEVPGHWEVMKATRLFEIGSGTTPPTDYAKYYGGDIAWITTSELRESVVMSTKKTVTREALKAFSTLNVYPEGSVAVAMYGATIGRIGVLGTEAAVNQACCVFSRPNGIDVWFWFYWLQHRRSYLISLGYGGGQPNLSQDLLKAIRVPIPPLPEQRTIAAFLDRETAKIDALVAKIRKVIDLLKEQRTALISAAVTGKIDVREAMA